MEAREPSSGISDWGLRQTSMEDVFLRIANAAETELLIASGEVEAVDASAARWSGPRDARRDQPPGSCGPARVTDGEGWTGRLC